jgi:integrase
MASALSRRRLGLAAVTSRCPISSLRHCENIESGSLSCGCSSGRGASLLFADINGKPLSPNAVSAAWADFAKSNGIPEITFHGLRHTHASQLIDAGVDIATIAHRLGHAKPDITLRIYAHLFHKDDSKAAAAINAAFKSKRWHHRGWQSGGNVHICSFQVRAKSLKSLTGKGGRVV